MFMPVDVVNNVHCIVCVQVQLLPLFQYGRADGGTAKWSAKIRLTRGHERDDRSKLQGRWFRDPERLQERGQRPRWSSSSNAR